MQKSNVIPLTVSYLITPHLGEKRNDYVGGLAKLLVKLFCYKRRLLKQQDEKICVIFHLLFYYLIVILYMSRNIKRKLEAGLKVLEMYPHFLRTGHMLVFQRLFR